MHYSKKDVRFYRIGRHTGERWNRLAIAFTEKTGIPIRICYSADGDEPARLLPEEVEKQVLKGIAEANDSLGTGYTPMYIEFSTTDSPPAGAYAVLANTLVHHLHELGEDYGERKLPDSFFLH